MLKINYYRLFLLSAVFFNSANVLCSSFNQSDSHQNPPNLSLHNANLRTNSSDVVNSMTTGNANLNSLPNDLLITNPSNMQHGGALPTEMGQFVFNGPNFIHVNNNNALLLLPLQSYNGTILILPVASNNTMLLFPLLNTPSAFTITNNAMLPAPHSGNVSNQMTSSFSNTNTNNCYQSIPSDTIDTSQLSLFREITPLNSCEQPKNSIEKQREERKNKPYHCPVCNKNLANISSFNYHLTTHDSNREKPYQCHLCKKKFTAKSSLKTHRMLVHTGVKPFKCHICQKGFSSKTVLNDHLNRHKKKKPYKCTQCSKAYQTKSGLNYHTNLHNMAKSYTCHYCNAVFIYKSQYENHIRYEEETDEDLICHPCQKVYTTKHGLSLHNKRVHPRINS